MPQIQGAPDEASAPQFCASQPDTAPAIEFRAVSAEASGHPILNEIDLTIRSRKPTRDRGAFGAGKSSW